MAPTGFITCLWDYDNRDYDACYKQLVGLMKINHRQGRGRAGQGQGGTGHMGNRALPGGPRPVPPPPPPPLHGAGLCDYRVSLPGGPEWSQSAPAYNLQGHSQQDTNKTGRTRFKMLSFKVL